MQLDSSDEDLILSVRPKDSVHALNFHPKFSSLDANVILAAKGAKLYFRIHLHTLKTTSGFFREMYNLPQSSGSQADIIYLDEDADVLERLFCMISGLPFSDISSHELLESLLFSAEKYDMPGPMSIMRMYLLTPSPLNDHIRLYAIASRYEWKQETQALATRTLSLNIFEEKYRPSLRALSASALLDLFILHRSRRDVFRQCLDAPPFVSGNPANCSQCTSPIEYVSWKELKYKMVMEMDRRPLGDTIIDTGLHQWPEALACWRASCPRDTCKRLLYDRTETIRVVKQCIDSLPTTV